jgi:hypothetical protein
MTSAETALLTKVYDLVGAVRGEMNAGFQAVDGRLGKLEGFQIRTETTNELEDSLADRRTSGFRWRVGIGLTVVFSGMAAAISIAHVVFGIGAG